MGRIRRFLKRVRGKNKAAKSAKPEWERHEYCYGFVCTRCGYHGKTQIGRDIHMRHSWPTNCEDYVNKDK